MRLLEFDAMPRPLFFLLSAILLIGVPPCAPAETIHLKNGRTIWAESVHGKGNQIEYSIGDNTFAIPKSLVERIDAGGTPPETSSGSRSTSDLPLASANSEIRVASEIYSKVIHDNGVDTDALAVLESERDTETAAAGYFIAGRFELEHNNFTSARSYYEKALRLRPDDVTLLSHYSATLIRMGHASDALPYAEHATRIEAKSADAWAVLGAAQYASDHVQAARTSWKQSLTLRADPNVERALAKADRDIAAEFDYSEKESSHFTLRFEGNQTSDSFRRSLLATLESQYDDLVRTLGVAPRDGITVILYTNQTFFDVTQAPSWTGAVNDGKLRIPVNGLDSVTGDLARVLKHELAHSFVNYISHGRCPQWLHEGIAQLVEPKSLSGRGQRLSQLFQTQQEIPFNMLEGGFMNFPAPQAVLAYDESLAAAEYIADTYGMSDLRRILQRIGEGSSTEAALRATIHSGYGSLGTDLAKFLASKYGN